MRPRALLCLALLLTALGCRPAARYTASPDTGEPTTGPSTSLPPIALPEDLAWKETWSEQKLVKPLVFVHAETNPTEWNKLERYWTAGVLAHPLGAVGLIGLNPVTAGPIVIAPDQEVIRIKVPRGLDDPTPLFPEVNPPTLAKWELGRRLFFSERYLSPKHNVSCAGCHLAERATRDHDGFKTPTLVNVAFNRQQFWDGRATHLEEVFARSLEDERDAEPTTFRHAWGGAVRRLREHPKFKPEFENVFGTLPSQDTAGKALATYLRTLLAGDSLHDRALVARDKRKSKDLEAADYESVLDDGALKSLNRAGQPKGEVATDLLYGYQLFHNLKPNRKLNCINCHSGRQFTDGKFHNVGVTGELIRDTYLGRSAHVPLGLKDRYLVGAVKTPTLRGLLRSAPYFHTGAQETLEAALDFHTERFQSNSYLAPEMHEEGLRLMPRYLRLTATEKRALLTFLRALGGEPMDRFVREAPSEP